MDKIKQNKTTEGQQESSETNIDSFKDNLNTGSPLLKLLSKSREFSYNKIEEFYTKSLKATKTGYLLYSRSDNVIWFSDELIQLLNIPVNNNQINATDLKKISTDDNLGFLEIITKPCEELLKKELLLCVHSDNEFKQQRIMAYQDFQYTDSNLILGIITDISEQKRYEETIAKEKEKAEEADRINTIFLTNISHEIRTPMNAIIGFNELLNISDIAADKKKEYLTIIKNKSKYLLSLIDDIVELSKFESGK